MAANFWYSVFPCPRRRKHDQTKLHSTPRGFRFSFSYGAACLYSSTRFNIPIDCIRHPDRTHNASTCSAAEGTTSRGRRFYSAHAHTAAIDATLAVSCAAAEDLAYQCHRHFRPLTAVGTTTSPPTLAIATAEYTLPRHDYRTSPTTVPFRCLCAGVEGTPSVARAGPGAAVECV